MSYFQDTSGGLHYLSAADIANGGESLLPAGCVSITDAAAQAIENPPLTAGQQLAQLAGTLLAAGLTITSTSTPAQNPQGTSDMITFMNSELNAILLNGTFTDGSTAIEWQDSTLGLHLFSIAQFKTFAAALGAFVSGVRKCIIGAAGAALPSSSVTIP